MPATPVLEDTLSQTERNKLAYPDPFFDLARNYIPKNIKTLFKFCRTFFYTTGFLRNVVTKLTEYPVTDILYDDTIDAEARKKWDTALHRKLKIKSFLIEIGLDFFIYGNALISIYMKPTRFLKCTTCKEEHPIDNVKYKLEKFKFKGTCPSCKGKGVVFSIKDTYLKTIDNFKFVRWAPENIDIDYNPLTGTSIYYYTIPSKIKAAIIAGNQAIIREVPALFLESLEKKKRIELDPKNLFHFKRPTLAEDDMGWGKPIILPALKEIYYLQTLRRGNEAIANDHVIPKKSIYPANTTTLDPYSVVPYTTVLTNNGIKELQHVDFKKDKLYSYNREETDVIDWKLREIEDWDYLVKVTAAKQPAFPIKVNSVHPFRVWVPSQKEHSWKMAKSLSVDDYLAYPVPILKEGTGCIQMIDTEELLKEIEFGSCSNSITTKISTNERFFRFIGLFISEGYLHQTGRVTFTFNSNETDLHKFVADYLNELAPNCKDASTYTNGTVTQVTKCSIKLKMLLEKLVGNLSDKKHLTYFRNKIDKTQLLALLQGLYEGDGCFRYSKNHGNAKYPKITLQLANLDISYFVWEHLLCFGLCSSIATYKKGSYKRTWTNDLTGKPAETLAIMLNIIDKFTYATESLNSTYFFHDDFVYTKVNSIKKIKERMVLSIEVDNNTHSYLTLAKSNKNTQMNLGKWKGQIEAQIKKWKYDPNHIGVFPIPIGYQELGGNARTLLLTPEMKFIEESIINSLGVPVEFVKGGTTWTGSSISLRIVENHFLTYRELLLDFLNYFVVPGLVSRLKYSPTKLKFKKFKMSDDIQAKNLVIQLGEQGKISDAKLLDEFGFDAEEEQEALKRSRSTRFDEQVAMQEATAEAQGRGAVILAKYQARAQAIAAHENLIIETELLQDELARENNGITDDPVKVVEEYALKILAMTPAQQNKTLNSMAKTMPITYSLVVRRIQAKQLEQAQQQAFIEQSFEPQSAPEKKKSTSPAKKEKTKGQTVGEP